MSFTRACLSASVRSFVCLFVCNIFTCQQYFMPTVRCIRMRQQLPLLPAPLLCRVSLDAARNRPKNVAQVERQLHSRRRATFTLTCRNLPAALLVLLLPLLLLLHASPACLLLPCRFFVQNCAHVLRNFSCVSMRRRRHCLCFACNKITVSVSRTQLWPLLLLLLLPLWLLFLLLFCPLITNAMATTTKSKTQFSAFAYIFVTMSTSFWNHCPAHGTITHSAVHLNSNTSVEKEATLPCCS